MYASEEESILTKIAEIATWVILFIALVPGTALGYFAENSLPNSPLYPVKRGIETVVLTLVSVNNTAKSAYQLNLVHIRLNETKKLFASNPTVTPQDFQQLDAVTTQLDAAKTSINSVSDSVQQAQMKQQLQTTVNEYQQQLTQMQQQLKNNEENPSVPTSQNQTSNASISSPTPTTTVEDNSSNNSPSSANDTSTSTPTPTPNFSNLTDQQKTDLEEKIQQENDKLQQLQQDLQDSNTSQDTNSTQDGNYVNNHDNKYPPKTEN